MPRRRLVPVRERTLGAADEPCEPAEAGHCAAVLQPFVTGLLAPLRDQRFKAHLVHPLGKLPAEEKRHAALVDGRFLLLARPVDPHFEFIAAHRVFADEPLEERLKRATAAN
eukprot:scaffold24096_cov64-Phaeocystis_antarctica.AAC.21